MTKCHCGQQDVNAEYEIATDSEGFTSCCGAQSTYMDDGYGGWELCCKCCYGVVTGGVADTPTTYRLTKEA